MRNSYNKKKRKFKKYKNIVIFLLLCLSFLFARKIVLGIQNYKASQLSDTSKTEKFYENLLVKSLSRLEYADDLKYGNLKKPALFISDTRGKKIFVITLNGKILYEIGSGKKGFKDEGFEDTQFCSPMGLAYKDNILYIADSCNNAIRKVDFKDEKVSTLIQNNERLKNPIDVKFFPDEKNLAISCLNKYGLNFYNTKNNNLKSAIEQSTEIRDIEKILKYDNKLYFLDAVANNIYSLDENGNVEEFLKINSDSIKADSFHIDDTGIYVLDKNNSKLFKANLEDRELKLYSGGNLRGNKLETIIKTEFNLPDDILAVKDRLYISDTKNYRIVEVDKNKDKTSAINIYPDFSSGNINHLKEYLNHSEFKDEIKFSYNKSGQILLNMGNDFKFTKNAPNSLYIFEQNENNAILIKSYSTYEIATKNLAIPKLEKDKIYYVKGTFFYCKKDEISPCLVKKYNKKLIANREDVDNYLDINFR